MIRSPVLEITEPTTITAQLFLSSDDGCMDTLTQIVEIEFIEVFLEDSILICNNEPTELNPDFNPAYTYEWTPATGLNDPNSPNPLANPANTTTYTVTISSFAEDTCQIVREVTAFVPPPIDLTTTGDLTICEEDVILEANSPQNVTFNWSLSPDFNPIVESGDEYLATPGQPSYLLCAGH